MGQEEPPKQRHFFGDVIFRIFRWSVVLIALGFVVRGWLLSYSKYTSDETSVSMKMNETEMHRYPSITFCPMFKQEVKMTRHILGFTNMSSCINRCNPDPDFKMLCQCNDLCNKFKDCCEDYEDLCLNNDTSMISTPLDTNDLTIGDIPFRDLVDLWSWERQDFLTMFAHNEHGDPQEAAYVLTNDTYWTETIPHPESGKCFTYDPPFESPHGWWHGIRFGIKLPHTEGGYFTEDIDEKERLFKDMMHIYIHEKGKFTFYTENDLPDCHKLDVSWLRYHRENNIHLDYKIFTALDRPDRPNFSYKILNHNHYLKWMDKGADWTVHIWFKNLRFSYEKEYIVCDWTCLIGEIGGNLGFFLGGSILAFIDILILTTRQRISKFHI